MRPMALALLLLACGSVSHAQPQRRRVGEPGPAQKGPPEPRGPGDRAPADLDCLPLLLPWALLLALSSSCSVYLLFSRGRGGADAGLDPEALPEEVLLWNIRLGLHVIYHQLWHMVCSRRKQQGRGVSAA